MSTYYKNNVIDGQNSFPKPVQEIAAEVTPNGYLVVMDEDEYITDQQRKWWKGILLKHLARDTGDSPHWWETHLKRAVMPDKFMRMPIASGRKIEFYVPSITILSRNQMNQMIEGSIAELRDETKYGDQFKDYTLPDKSKRSEWGMEIQDKNRHLEYSRQEL